MKVIIIGSFLLTFHCLIGSLSHSIIQRYIYCNRLCVVVFSFFFFSFLFSFFFFFFEDGPANYIVQNQKFTALEKNSLGGRYSTSFKKFFLAEMGMVPAQNSRVSISCIYISVNAELLYPSSQILFTVTTKLKQDFNMFLHNSTILTCLFYLSEFPLLAHNILLF